MKTVIDFNRYDRPVEDASDQAAAEGKWAEFMSGAEHGSTDAIASIATEAATTIADKRDLDRREYSEELADAGFPTGIAQNVVNRDLPRIDTPAEHSQTVAR